MRFAYKFNAFNAFLLCLTALALLFCLTAPAQQMTNPHTQIRWPITCNTPNYTYDYFSNICVQVGPVGTTGSVQMTNAGVWATAAGFSYNFGTNTLSIPNVSVPGTSTITIPPTQVTWPASCTTGVYFPATNTCVPPGTAANPAGSNGQMQYNLSGIFGAIPGSSVDSSGNVLSFVGQAIGGLRYSAQYPTGLLGAMATNQTVFTDPTDTTTSTAYTFTSPPPGMPANFTWADFRHGNYQGWQEVFEDFGFTRSASFNFAPTGHAINCLIKRPSNAAGTTLTYCLNTNQLDTAPGLDTGNQPVTPAGGGIWNTSIVQGNTNIRYGGGIVEAIANILVHPGYGDTAAMYNYTYSWGGQVDSSAEGNETQSNIAQEGANQFTAVCSTGCTTGSMQMLLITPTGCTFGSFTSYCTDGVGRPLIDVTKGPFLTTTVSNIGAGLNSGLAAVTIAATVTASNAWGTLVANLQPNAADMSGPPNYATQMTFAVNVTSGTFVAGTLACFANQSEDEIMPTSVTGAGPVMITAYVYTPHAAGGVLMQGGPCGRGLEVTGETVGTNMYLGYVIGATTANVLQVTWYKTTGTSATPGSASLFTGGIMYGTSSVTGLSSSGASVYATGQVNGSLSLGQNTLSRQSVIFSGASDTAFNGTACSNLQWQANTTTFTCTMAGLTGFHTATTATFALANSSGAPMSTINLWNMARVVDVQNESLSPPAMDGTIYLAPNPVQWAASDTVRQLNHEALILTGGKFNISGANPHAVSAPLFASVLNGIIGTGGGASTSSNAIVRLGNGNLDSACTDGGGPYNCPNVINHFGPYYIGFDVGEGPASTQPFLYVQTTTAQKANPNYFFYGFSSTDNSTGTSLKISTRLGDATLATSGQLQLGAPQNVHFNNNIDGAISNDRIQFQALTIPTGVSVSQGPGSGTLADGTYCYVIASRNNVGFTTGSTEACGAVANGGSNSVQISWTRNKGTNLYYIYGRTTGAELQMANVTSNVLFFVDNGSITPSGSIPGTNATLGLLDQSANVGYNSSGTAFETIVQAAAGNAANNTITLPNTAGRLGFGLTIPTGTPTYTAGTNVTSCGCAASYTCTNTRGRLTIVGGTATTGTICTLTFSASLTTAPFFTLNEMGFTTAHGLDHGVPSATLVTITAAITVSGVTVTADYFTQP
jgi:hypothetical protein